MGRLFRNVHLVDPAAGRNGRFDLLLDGDRIVRIEPNLPVDDAEVVELPVADGGESTAEVLHRELGGTWRRTTVADPFGRRVSAAWLVLPDGRAVVEASAAIGLPLLARDELDPLRGTDAAR